MYTQFTLCRELHDRLEALEQELDRPIRVVIRRNGLLPDWVTAHIDPLYPDEVTVDQVHEARDRGVTLAVNDVNAAFTPTTGNYRDVVGGDGFQLFGTYQPTATDSLVSPIIWSDVVIGRVEPRLVGEHFDLRNYGTMDPSLVDTFVAAVKLSAEAEFAERFEQLRQEAQRNTMREYFRSMHNGRLTAIREQIVAHETATAARKQKLTESVQAARALQRELDAMLIVQQEETGESIMRAWEQLLQHPRVTLAEFTDSKIHIVTTDDLRIHHPETDESRWLGAFDITIDIASYRMKINNLNTARGGRDHPHISNGEPCFGGHDSSFNELLGRGEIYVVFELLLQYLETLNIRDDWGRYGAYWFDAPDDAPARR